MEFSALANIGEEISATLNCHGNEGLNADPSKVCLKGEPFVLSIGGAEKEIAHDGPRYSAIYNIDGPHVLVSPEWAKAVELGRWPSHVRPYTRNRRHALYRVC